MQMGETYRRTNITATLHQSGLYGDVAKLNALLSEDTFGICKKKTPKRPSDCEKQDSLVWCTSILSIMFEGNLWSTIPKVKCAGSSFILWGCFQRQGLGDWSRLRESWMKKSTEIAEGSPSNMTMTLITQPRQHSGSGTTKQSSDLNPIEHLWRDLKMAVHWWSQSNLTDLERICKEEWQKIHQSRCVKLVVSYPKRLEAVTAAKGAPTKYWSEYLC